MKTVKDVLSNYKEGLSGLYDPREAESIALLLLGELTGTSRPKLKFFQELEIPDAHQEVLSQSLDRLKTGEPVQYIMGQTEFYGLPFKVDGSVLIPRPETEELVDWILKSKLPAQSRILDIGTGSGCIAITLKKNLPEATVSAMDITVAALYTAKQNAELNDVVVNFIRQDILEPGAAGGLYDVIVSNPPYVTLDDKKQMHANVTDFEPHSALFVPEDDPLIFYRAIAEYAMVNLADNGYLFFEINESLGKETVALLELKGFRDVVLRQDLSDRDRMLRARYALPRRDA